MKSVVVCVGLAGILACGAATTYAQGGPPLITDDPDTPGPGYWEINLAAQSDAGGRSHTFETPRLDANYGVGERIQLKFELPWVRVRDHENGVATGIGDATAGVKWRFIGQEHEKIAWSIYPQLELGTAASPIAQVVEGGRRLELPTELTLEIAKAEINMEVGRTFTAGAHDNWIDGLSTEVHALPRLELLAELHGEQARGARPVLIANFGARPKLTRQLTLLFAAGRTVRNRPGERHVIVYAGFQLSLPGRYVPASRPSAVRAGILP